MVTENAAAVDLVSIATVNRTEIGWFVSEVEVPSSGRNRTTAGPSSVDTVIGLIGEIAEPDESRTPSANPITYEVAESRVSLGVMVKTCEAPSVGSSPTTVTGT